MAEIITLVKYQNGELSIRVFKTLDEAEQVISKEYLELLRDFNDEDSEHLYKESDISGEYAFVYVEDNTHTIWEIFTIQV